MPPTIVYAAGYAGQQAETLRRGMVALGAFVVDVRYQPRSSRREWNRIPLAVALEGRYRWLRAWGNLHQGNPSAGIKLMDFNAGMEAFEQVEGPVVLLCRCSNYDMCHIKSLVGMIEPRGYEVRLFDWDAYLEAGLF
jgi:Protein of unknown function, DUF488